jgi:hypothetical protein
MLRIEMKKQPCETDSTYIQDACRPETASPCFISVREAALRLRRSKSTVYRLNREHGPFRIVVDGRHIFIELASFERYLATSGDILADDGFVELVSGPSSQQMAGAPETQAQIDEPKIESSQPAGPCASLPASKSGGQRGLIMREGSVPCVIFYPVFMV